MLSSKCFLPFFPLSKLLFGLWYPLPEQSSLESSSQPASKMFLSNSPCLSPEVFALQSGSNKQNQQKSQAELVTPDAELDNGLKLAHSIRGIMKMEFYEEIFTILPTAGAWTMSPNSPYASQKESLTVFTNLKIT